MPAVPAAVVGRTGPVGPAGLVADLPDHEVVAGTVVAAVGLAECQ